MQQVHRQVRDLGAGNKGRRSGKCAIDFIQNSEGGNSSLVGIVRFDSTCE